MSETEKAFYGTFFTSDKKETLSSKIELNGRFIEIDNIKQSIKELKEQTEYVRSVHKVIDEIFGSELI